MPEIRNLSFSYDGTPVFSGSVSRCRTAAAPPCWRPRDSARPPCSDCSAAVLPPRAAASPGFRRRESPWYSRRTACCPAAQYWKTCGWWLRSGRTQNSLPCWENWDCPAGKTPAPGSSRAECARRAAIARALVFHSPLVIMDEPFKGLDEATCGDPRLCGPGWLGDRTFLLVTHSPQEAERLGCRITRLDELTRTSSEKQN